MQKVTIIQPKIKGCDNSFFYEGLIAETKKHEMIATGEIRIHDKNGELVHDNWKERNNDIKLENDKDLKKVGNNWDDQYYWDMSNWFEIYEKGTDDMGEVLGGYDESIKYLKSLK